MRRSDALRTAADVVAEELALVEERIHAVTRGAMAPLPAIGAALMGAGGKRLRPLLVLLGARVSGVAVEPALAIATIAEVLHCATLLHDDVVDGADLRRGRPSARFELGNAVSILAGDFFLARALAIAARIGDGRVIASLGAVIEELVEGEVAQLAKAGSVDVESAELESIAERKTASLFGWCASVAGVAEPTSGAALRRYGRSLGRAFQIMDDVSDCIESSDSTGKLRGQDLREGNVTLPIHLACEANAAFRARVAATFSSSTDAAELESILDEVGRLGGIDAALAIARTHAEDAAHAARSLPASPARDALSNVATSLVDGR